jgi:O-antigen/teichoic acid export membrane protein
MITLLRVKWGRVCSSSLARNAAWMTVGQTTSYLLQGIYFVVVARLLGAVEYGVFAGAFAFVNLVARYGTLGTGTVLVRYVSVDRKLFPFYWGNVVVVTSGGGIIMLLILHLVGRHVLNPASAAIVLLAALANCFGTQFNTCAAQVFQASEQMGISAMLNLLTNLLRAFAATALLLFFHRVTAWQWAVISTVVSLIGAAAAVAGILVRFGMPRFSADLLRRRSLEGAEFAFASSTTSAYNDLDKAMLSHYGMNGANGIYTLAYRAVDVASMPIYSLLAAAMPRFFRKGVDGLPEAAAFARRLWKPSFVFSVLAALSLFFIAPLIPRFTGRSFGEATAALRWLCLIPVFRGVHEVTGSALTGAGLQRYRTATQVAAVALNLILNLWLIPLHGWRGAAWSSLATDGALGAMNWATMRLLVSKSRARNPRQLVTSGP